MIASGVMLTALTSMAYVITNTLYDVAGARQRQTAVALADEALEQARALPYVTLAQGVESAYLAGDPRVLGLGTQASPYALATTGEELVHNPDNSTIAPLVPNVTSRTVDGVVYAVRFYVSHFENNKASGILTLTAYADWSGGRGRRASSVRATTVKYSPDGGCPSVSPFAGPSPACIAARASVAPGRIRLAGSGTAGAAITNTWSELPSARSSLARGQVASTGGEGKGGGIVVGGAPVQPTSATLADDNPATKSIDGDESKQATTSSTTYGTSAGPGTISLTVTGTPTLDRSESKSAVAATGTQCPNPSGANQADLLPCDRSLGEQGGALRQVFDLGVLGLGSIALSEVTAPPSPVVAYTKLKESSTGVGAPCRDTTSHGCVHTSVSRSIGRIRVGGLPSAAAIPALFSGYLYELDNYSDSAVVEAGIKAAAPSVPPPTGTFRYWNGLGYTTIAMSGSSAFSVSTPTITASVGFLYSVSVSSTIVRGASSIQSNPTTCTGALPCVLSSEVVVGAPLVATTTYAIRLAGATIYELTQTLDLGELRAQAAYVPPTP